jgi:hypothetical protein
MRQSHREQVAKEKWENFTKHQFQIPGDDRPKKQTPWSESASDILTERLPLVGEVIANFCG